MSYWVYLEDSDGISVQVDHFEEGGTLPIGGSSRAELNITYNYWEVYRVVDFSVRMLDGKRARDRIEMLREAVRRLGTRKYERDYWAPTPGNAGFALSILLKWAEDNPEAVFRVS